MDHQVGDACANYSHIWRRPEGLYVSIEHKGNIRQVLRSCGVGPAARIAVVTDGKYEYWGLCVFGGVG